MTKDLKLQEYFKFTQSDLQQNQQGRVTEKQQAHVKGKVQRFNSRIIVVLVIMFVIGFGVNFAVRMASASGNFSGSIPTAALGPVITIVVLILFMVFRTNKKNDFSLKKVEGTVNFAWVERRVSNMDRTGYKTEKSLEMRVGGVTFNVSPNLMDIIDQGDNVRFYYTGGGEIVSAEFV
ncbi:MAG: hypothetical protein IH588_12220 [Anaerolineales bacterium]|nr:hypothetical protein [Anaerolineales bacterium]